ncbi:MAG TPA: hypothetical protein VK804_02515 [Bradyrhizobium sp.]|uniref:hypothetical protein n=1 Tax=Bradyrhizobium sp. TaxID=376 RepID=UPI002BE3ACCF|nr:hypothetical protein [Bradyrhizobium sp.]HTA99323.1 hypothetical protein [Bradyrhizobium sp.]
MAKIDLDALGIEELAALRETAGDILMEKVVARRAELEAELEKLSVYGKPAKKPQAEPTPSVKAKKSDERKSDEKKADEAKDPVAKAA